MSGGFQRCRGATPTSSASREAQRWTTSQESRQEKKQIPKVCPINNLRWTLGCFQASGPPLVGQTPAQMMQTLKNAASVARRKQSGEHRASRYRWPVRLDPSCDAGGPAGLWDERKLLGFSRSADPTIFPPSKHRRTRGNRRRGGRPLTAVCHSTLATPPAGGMQRKSVIRPPSLKEAAPLVRPSPADFLPCFSSREG